MRKVVTIQEARSAKEKAKTGLAGNSAVVGVGLTKGKWGYAVKVNVRDSSGPPIPDSLDGVPIVKVVIGDIRKR